MPTIYQYDDQGVFTGATREIGQNSGAPLGWTRTTPPDLTGTEVAKFSGRNGWQVLSDSPPETKPTPDEIAAERYRREISGITINGMFITTGDRSKTLLNGKVNRALIAQSLNDTAWTANWKLGTTWVSLTADQIIGIGMAVDDYIQGCFDNEGQLVSDLLAGNPIDINAGWPATEVTL